MEIDTPAAANRHRDDAPMTERITFPSKLRDGDLYTPTALEDDDDWEEVLGDPEEVGDEIRIEHVADDGESPAYIDSGALIKRRRAAHEDG